MTPRSIYKPPRGALAEKCLDGCRILVVVHQLNNTVTLLTSVGRRHEQPIGSEVGEASRSWADHNDFELPIPAPQTRQANGLEIRF